MTSLKLDHASLAVPDLGGALSRLSDLGLRATPTPVARERHSRLYLDRTYVEVSQPSVGGASVDWELPLFFLRFVDRAQTVGELQQRGIESELHTYEGVDGTWEELKLIAPAEVCAPILVRRTAPAETAVDWPPALRDPQPCGARVLGTIVIGCAHLEETRAFYERLLGVSASEPRVDRTLGGLRRDLNWAGQGLALIQSDHSSVRGLVFEVLSLAALEAFLGAHDISYHRTNAEVWVNSDLTHRVFVGFSEGALVDIDAASD